MQRVVVTGFEPYWNYEYNSSWEVAKEVASLDGLNVDIIAEQLPVSFKRVGECLQQIIKKHKPNVLLMLGQSGGSDRVKLERTALNLMDAKLSDNDGCIPDEVPINTCYPPALFTNMPVKILRQKIEELEIPVKISNSCGLYVCNCLYYEALMQLKSSVDMKVLFVHLPFYEGQPGVKKGKPVMPISQMVTALKTIIETCNDA